MNRHLLARRVTALWGAALVTVTAVTLVLTPTAMADAAHPITGMAINQQSSSNIPVWYGYCAETVPIRAAPTVRSKPVGVCKYADPMRSNEFRKGSNGTCGGFTTDVWFYIRDLKSNVTGWISECAVAFNPSG